MSSNRRKLRIINSVTVNMGCSCRRPRLADIFRPKPKSKTDNQQHKSRLNTNGATTRSSSSTCYYNTNTNSSSSSWGKATTLDNDEDDEGNSNATFDTPTYSDPESDPSSCSKLQGVQMCGKVGESLAVVKDSDDPYLDFRHSMLQMILEKEIYSRDDLRELLDCFLSLNSPYHHEIIVRAFTEIWNGVFSMKQQQHQQQQRQRVRRRKSREY